MNTTTNPTNPRKPQWYTPAGYHYDIFQEALAAPHLLIAGASGSGKSVLLHGLIAEILMRCPCDVPGGAGMILIDPKLVELEDFKDLPHTVTCASGYNPSGWASALACAARIMDSRFKTMRDRREKLYSGADLYVIVDEFASLYLDARKQTDRLIQRISCEGRAARVHLILATQCPNRDVLPTRIQCNFDTRFALRTETRIESRVILGRSGCELLPSPRKEGRAEAYFLTPGDERKYKLPYVKDGEINRLVAWWMCQKIQNDAEFYGGKGVNHG